MTLLPSETLSKPKLLCLKYYRGNSDGWKNLGNCDNCVEEYIDIICPLTHCRLPNVCSCTIFTRKPPSLLHSAAHVLFKHHLHVERFELTADIIYQQYV